MNSRYVISVFTLFVLTSGAQAQSAYRCEENGSVTYQATPCAGGRAVSGDARAQAQRDQALQTKMEQDKLAAKMEKDRAARARAAGTPAGASSMKPEEAVAKKEKAVKQRKRMRGGKKSTDPKVFGEEVKSKKPAKPAALKSAK